MARAPADEYAKGAGQTQSDEQRVLAHPGGTARTFEIRDGRGGVAAAESRAGDERRADGDQLQVSSPRCPPGSLLCCRFAKCKPELKNVASHYSY